MDGGIEMAVNPGKSTNDCLILSRVKSLRRLLTYTRLVPVRAFHSTNTRTQFINCYWSMEDNFRMLRQIWCCFDASNDDPIEDDDEEEKKKKKEKSCLVHKMMPIRKMTKETLLTRASIYWSFVDKRIRIYKKWHNQQRTIVFVNCSIVELSIFTLIIL